MKGVRFSTFLPGIAERYYGIHKEGESAYLVTIVYLVPIALALPDNPLLPANSTDCPTIITQPVKSSCTDETKCYTR